RLWRAVLAGGLASFSNLFAELSRSDGVRSSTVFTARRRGGAGLAFPELFRFRRRLLARFLQCTCLRTAIGRGSAPPGQELSPGLRPAQGETPGQGRPARRRQPTHG